MFVSLLLWLVEGGEMGGENERVGGEECGDMLIVRFRCKDRDGTFMVETTAWEGREDGKQAG